MDGDYGEVIYQDKVNQEKSKQDEIDGMKEEVSSILFSLLIRWLS